MAKEMNIFLVEDNDLDVEMLERGLRKLGASGTLVRAADGLDALDILKRDIAAPSIPRPYVILLDVNMPRMNGHEFLAALRDDSDLGDARVYMFTTSDSERDIRQAYRNHANGYIVKPHSLKELGGVLQTLREFWAICEDPV